MLDHSRFKHLDKINHFVHGLHLTFPSNTTAAPYLNDIFEKGLSLNQFQSKYEKECKAKQVVHNPHFKYYTNLVLAKDIWGPSRVLSIGKESTVQNGPDCSIAIQFRDQNEFIRLEHFASKQPNFRILEDLPGRRTYEIMAYKDDYNDVRSIVFFISTPSEQETRLSLTLSF